MIRVLPSVLMLIGMTVTAWFSYRGSLSIGRDKASKESVEHLEKQVEHLTHELEKYKSAYLLKTEENLELMKKILQLNK